MELWERFSGHARRAVLRAHEEAQRAKRQQIGTEHLLLGMLKLADGGGAEILGSLRVDVGDLRSELQELVLAATPEEPTRFVAFTPEAQKVLSHAYNEAKNLGHTYIGTEHLLVGLVRESRGAAHRILERCGLDLDKVRNAVGKCAKSNVETRKKGDLRGGLSQLKMGLGSLQEGLKRVEQGLERIEGQEQGRKDFGRAVAELGKEANLDALVLVIGRDGLESCLSTKPRHLRELLEYVKRLLEEEDERREAEDEEEGEEPEEGAAE